MTKDSDQRTALHFACEQSPSPMSNEIILKLMESGVRLDEIDNKGKSAFEYAIYSKGLAPIDEEFLFGSNRASKQRLPNKRDTAQVDEFWMPLGDLESESDSDSDLDDFDDFDETYAQQQHQKYHSEATQDFWRCWNAKIVNCIKHMSKDQLNQRMSTGRYPANTLVEHAESATIRLMFEKDVNMNSVDNINPGIALDAAARGDCSSDIAGLLISKTQRPLNEFTSSQKRNPLQTCCAQLKSSTALLRRLITAGASPILPDRDGMTPLMIAAAEGAIDHLKLLLRHGVPIDAQEYGIGSTALHWAVCGKSIDCVLALLEARARVDIKSESGPFTYYTPLHLSGFNELWDIAEIILRHSAPLLTLQLSGGTSILHKAAGAGKVNILRLILDLPERPDLDTKDKERYTPLELATNSGVVACFELLLESGASIETGTELTGGVEHAAMIPLNDDIRTVLLGRNIRFNSTSIMPVSIIDYSNVLPLHRAAFYGNNKSIHFLHDNGLIGDINALAEHDMTALHFAACSDQADTIKLLLSLNADAESVERRHGRTPLLVAAAYDCKDTLIVLLDHGCSTTAEDFQGLTAYMTAINKRKAGTMSILKGRMHLSDGDIERNNSTQTTKRIGFSLESAHAVPSTNKLPTQFQDIAQHLANELSEIKQLLVKPPLTLNGNSGETLKVPSEIRALTEIIELTNTTNQAKKDAVLASGCMEKQKEMTESDLDTASASELVEQHNEKVKRDLYTSTRSESDKTAMKLGKQSWRSVTQGNKIVIAMMAMFIGIMIWVVVLLGRMNEAMAELKGYIPRAE